MLPGAERPGGCVSAAGVSGASGPLFIMQLCARRLLAGPGVPCWCLGLAQCHQATGAAPFQRARNRAVPAVPAASAHAKHARRRVREPPPGASTTVHEPDPLSRPPASTSPLPPPIPSCRYRRRGSPPPRTVAASGGPPVTRIDLGKNIELQERCGAEGGGAVVEDSSGGQRCRVTASPPQDSSCGETDATRGCAACRALDKSPSAGISMRRARSRGAHREAEEPELWACWRAGVLG